MDAAALDQLGPEAAKGADIGTGWLVALNRKVLQLGDGLAAQQAQAERQAETIANLMDLVEDTMPIQEAHSLFARAGQRADAAAAEASAAGRTAASKLESQLVTLGSRVGALDTEVREVRERMR